MSEKMVNGVDVGLIEEIVEAIQKQADVAKFKFRVNNKWVNGAHNHSVVGDFYGSNEENQHLKTFEFDADEPPMMGGSDIGANPVEYLLSALSSCLTTTLIYHAAIRGIQIEELEAQLEGDLDMRGFLGMSNEVRKGFQEIRVHFKVKTDEENLEKLKALSKLSPVFDVTSNGTKVDVSIERK